MFLLYFIRPKIYCQATWLLSATVPLIHGILEAIMEKLYIQEKTLITSTTQEQGNDKHEGRNFVYA